MKQVNISKIYRILKQYTARYKFPYLSGQESPFKILISTILSARTKDETTAKASEKLFSKAKSLNDLKKLSVKEIEKLIYPVGFYKTKAKNLKKLSEIKKIPGTIEELIELPGVGRKTANLVVSRAFKKPAICVDVHVHRILNRLGYIETKNPFETEMELRKKLPKRLWRKINSVLVLFGQNLCKPLSPFCSRCPIEKYCNKIGVKKSR